MASNSDAIFLMSIRAIKVRLLCLVVGRTLESLKRKRTIISWI